MANRADARARLQRLFRHTPVVDLAALRRALDTTSRTTVFRALSDLGYMTSCSHAGRYYTLADIPSFDDEGLWVHGDALFSRHGTLRATLVNLVDVASAGRTHAEFQARLRLRVHDTLRDLVKAEEIGREQIERIFLYVAIDPKTAAAQVLGRRRALEAPTSPPAPPGPVVVIEVLVEIIHDAKVRADPAAIVRQLAARGINVTVDQVEEVLGEHGIQKKRAPSRSRRSRR